MFAILAAILILCWLLAFLAFHVTAGLIHLVLLIGLVMLVIHFIRGRTARV